MFMTMIFLPMDLFISGVFTGTLKLQGQFLGASYRHENAFNYFAAKISISFRTHPISMEYPVESRTRSGFYLHLHYNLFCHRILLRQIKEVSHVFLRTISPGCHTQTQAIHVVETQIQKTPLQNLSPPVPHPILLRNAKAFSSFDRLYTQDLITSHLLPSMQRKPMNLGFNH